jgi:hypothetical protein
MQREEWSWGLLTPNVMYSRTWSLIDIGAMCAIPLTFLAAWRWEWFGDHAAREPVRVWVLQIGLLLLFSLALGKSKGRGALGVVIDEASRVSLSRVQAFIWSVLLIGGIATAVTVNVARGCQTPAGGVTPVDGSCAGSPFAIDLPNQLLILAGISALTAGISAVVTVRGLTRETRWTGSPEQIAQMDELGYLPRGIVAAKTSASRATLGDLVRGFTVIDNPGIDLTRVQFLALTLVLSGGYAVTFAQGLSQNVHQPIDAFPGFSSGLTILFGMSAGLYLGVKAVRTVGK